MGKDGLQNHARVPRHVLPRRRPSTLRHHGVPAGAADGDTRAGHSPLLHPSQLLLARRTKIHGTGAGTYFRPPMYDFIQRAKHGGISTITHRYARANNPYMGRIRGKMPKEIMNELRQRTKNESQFSMEMVCEYFPDFSKREIKDLRRRMSIGEVFNPQEATTYLQYLDANNLYGWATSQPLPVGGFEWMTGEELGLPIGEMPPCFIEVDLEFPVELQDKFAELVPASENITPEGSNVQKLAQNLLPKKGYMCHIKNLTLYIELGVKLVKVRKGVKFEKKPWLKSYIDMNTELRAAATNDADKDMYKLLNNTVFGKTCENLFKRTDYRLVSWRNEALKLIAKPTFKEYTVYNEKLAGIYLDPSSVTLNKPSYVGVSVLKISKALMYRFHYDVKARYGNRAKLLMTDMESLFYHIETEDWYDDIRDDVPAWYDTSAYPKDHPAGLPRVNKKVIGMMKDELKGRTVAEFCGNRAKSYTFTVDDYPGMCDKMFWDGGCNEKDCIGNGGKVVKIRREKGTHHRGL